MKLKTSISLMIAVVLGLVTAKVGLDMLKSYGAHNGPALTVVTAVNDLDPGHVITAADVKLESLPERLINDKMIRQTKVAVGRTVVATVAAGYPLTEAVLAPAGAGQGLQAMVPDGYRAVTLDVADSSGVAGLLTPGCRVDVIATLRMAEQSVARTVVENVKVQFVQRGRTSRSTNPNFAPEGNEDNGPVKSVTLLVTPKQAAAIELASAEGKPRLVLRGNSDNSTTETASITRRELLGLPDDPDPAPPPKADPAPPPQPTDAFAQTPPPDSRPGRTVEIIRGGTTSTVTMDPAGSDAGAESTADPSSAKAAASSAPRESARGVSGSSFDRAPRKQAQGGN